MTRSPVYTSVDLTGGAGDFKNAGGEIILTEADPPVFAFGLFCN